jgi:uncharacterized protein (TIGR01777 family)
MNVLLTGATGFVGSRLKTTLQGAGHAVTTVGRGPGSDTGWDEAELSPAVAACDAIVHLAGENLFARRWSDEQKKKLVASRVDTTTTLARLAARHGTRAFVSASAVGWYGAQGDQELDETAPRGTGFLADLCRDWEQATEAAAEAGVRTCRVRTGVVLGLEDGALAKMLTPFKLGVGGPLGSGRQQVSWIHLDDLCRIYLHLVEHERASGAFNGTAPNPVTMRELAKTLGSVLHRPALLPVPAPVLRIALGDVADVLLTGQRVLPRRTQESGFAFLHPEQIYFWGVKL